MVTATLYAPIKNQDITKTFSNLLLAGKLGSICLMAQSLLFCNLEPHPDAELGCRLSLSQGMNAIMCSFILIGALGKVLVKSAPPIKRVIIHIKGSTPAIHATTAPSA